MSTTFITEKRDRQSQT